MPAIDPRKIEVMSPERLAEVRRMTPRESLEECFRLGEQKRSEIAAEIAALHPELSPREVELERNRRWLLMGLEGQVFGASSEVLYDLLCVNQRREGANLDRVVRLLGVLPETFRGAFQTVVDRLGLEAEWREATVAYTACQGD